MTQISLYGTDEVFPSSSTAQEALETAALSYVAEEHYSSAISFP